MKNLILSLVVIVTSLLSLPLFSQNNNEPVALGLPGDNLNLYAVLEVFQKSPTLEAFEREINDKETKINNLDLNNDNIIDYIQVFSYKEGNTHSIVLRVAINSKEYQDVAVIEVEKNKSGKIIVQIIGDEELYGNNYIVEPAVVNISETPNPGFTTEKTVIINNTYSITNLNGSGFLYVNDWPVIIHLFSPAFVVYASPWYWGYYPSYWYPWPPVYYYNYWGYHNHYYRNYRYRRAAYIGNPVHYSNYTRRRFSSPTVIQNRRIGRYDATYQGRTYRRPDVQGVRATSPSPRTIRPSTRPVSPSTRPVTPTTRPIEPRTRPTAPSTRPAVPTTRPIAPSNRPTREFNRPSRRDR
ncbi:MAG: hypothetical protein ABWZ56_04180 [Flavobacterium sp.]